MKEATLGSVQTARKGLSIPRADADKSTTVRLVQVVIEVEAHHLSSEYHMRVDPELFEKHCVCNHET